MLGLFVGKNPFWQGCQMRDPLDRGENKTRFVGEN